MKFFQERFDYVAEDDDAIEYLRATHDKFLPKVFARPDIDTEDAEIVIPPPEDAAPTITESQREGSP